MTWHPNCTHETQYDRSHGSFEKNTWVCPNMPCPLWRSMKYFFIKTTLVHFEVPSPKYLADLAVIFQTLPAWSGAGQAAYCRWSGHEGLVQFCMGRVRSSNSLSSKESVHYTSGMCSSKYQVWSGSQSLVPLDKIWFWWGSYCAILVGRDIRQALQNTQPWHRVSKLLPFGSQQGCFWFLCRNMVLR